MTVEISYFAGTATGYVPIPADPLASESVAITSSAALSGATPDAPGVVSLIGTEAFRFEYSRNGGAAATATSHYAAAGERVWLAPRAGYKFSLRTA